MMTLSSPSHGPFVAKTDWVSLIALAVRPTSMRTQVLRELRPAAVPAKGARVTLLADDRPVLR